MRCSILLFCTALLAMLDGGCHQTPVQSLQSAPPEPGTLHLRLDNAGFRGGEQDKFWHLTTWTLENESSKSIDEVVILVTLFDKAGQFLGHHSLTFPYIAAGGEASQKRLLFLKSDNLGEWSSRCESVRCRAHGDVTNCFQLTNAQVDKLL